MTVRNDRAKRPIVTDDRGATIMEFALVSPLLILVVLGIFDLGYRAYAGTMLQGALDRASRRMTIGDMPETQMDAYITAQMGSFSGDVTVAKSSYSNFSQIGKPEKITTDTPPVGIYNRGDCFEDLNENGVWDASDTGRRGTGGSDDIAYYTATARFKAVVPIRAFLGWSADERVTAMMMMRNQPYANQPVPSVVCR